MKLKSASIAILLMAVVLFPAVNSEENETENYSFSGNVYTNDGFPANLTSIKFNSMQSIWSSEGTYDYGAVPSGIHTARAYFMNDGHTVVYRKVLVDSDTSLDWYEGKNWATFKLLDEQGMPVSGESDAAVEILETGESLTLHGVISELGPYDIGAYYNIRVDHGTDSGPHQHVHFRMEPGSSSNPWPNDFEFRPGHNSKYGYLLNPMGAPVTGAMVSIGSTSTVTNDDGFFLLQNLEIGVIETLVAQQWGIEITDPVSVEVSAGEGWFNLTSTLEPRMPVPADFTTQITTTAMEPVEIAWETGLHTDFTSLYMNGDLVYKGNRESFLFEPTEPGTHVFQLESFNSNGSILGDRSLQVVVLPPQSASDLWSSGMSWSYHIISTPEYHQNKTYTAIGTEIVEDAFGEDLDTYVLRVTDEAYGEGEKAFRWVDSENLLNVKTFWSDAPESSSYYQQGHLGWRFSYNGLTANLLSGSHPDSLHFNRTNIIGVPGHPNGYDDTLNTVQITEGVEITTPAGLFTTTYISITDDSDGVVSWELWYNSTVRNYVRIIDRIPGSHSDSVIYDLTSFDVPTAPSFLTETNKLFHTDSYVIQWADYQGASSYDLYENGDLIYTGEETNFRTHDREDGSYAYEISATMPSGEVVQGEGVDIEVLFILQPPEFTLPEETITHTSDVSGGILVEWSVMTAQEETVLESQCGVNIQCQTEVDSRLMEEISWFQVTAEKDGVTEVLYRGPDNTMIFSEEESGQYRIRVQAHIDSRGSTSEYSDSIFIIVDIEPERTSWGMIGFVIFTLIAALILMKWRDEVPDK